MQTEKNLTAFQEFARACVGSEIMQLQKLLAELEIKIQAGEVTSDDAKALVSTRLQKFSLRVDNW